MRAQGRNTALQGPIALEESYSPKFSAPVEARRIVRMHLNRAFRLRKMPSSMVIEQGEIKVE